MPWWLLIDENKTEPVSGKEAYIVVFENVFGRFHEHKVFLNRFRRHRHQPFREVNNSVSVIHSIIGIPDCLTGSQRPKIPLLCPMY